jgi:hypothetical protein
VPDSAVDEVLGLIRTDDDLPRLVDVLQTLSDKQRKALSGPVGKHAEGVWLDKPGRNAAALAVLGCVTGVRQVAARLEWIPLDQNAEALAVEVVGARRPHWLPALPEALLVGRERTPQSFRLVRALVRAGLIPCPEFPEYVLSMVRGLEGRFDWNDGPTVLDRLHADPGLLEHELWELLATEGAGKLLTSHDGWLLKPYEPQFGSQPAMPARPERTWQHAIVALAAEGAVERSRLIDVVLGAFFRDWTPGDVGWFVKLHDALKPTVEEIAARLDTYGRLLAVEPGPAVNLGLRALSSLLRAEHLDVEVLLANAPAALARSDKGPVGETLKLLAAVGKVDPTLVDRVAGVAAAALAHERVDVQERALALVTKLVPDAARREAVIAGHAEALAPSLRPSAPAESARRGPARPTVAEPLEPVSGPDELADLLARLVEEADDPSEVERLLEGVARLATDRPTSGTEALIKRLQKLAGDSFLVPWIGEDLRVDLVQLGLVWLARHRPGKGHPGRQYDVDYRRGQAKYLWRPDWSLTAVVTMRVHEVAIAVSNGGTSLLSFPATRDGSLSAQELNTRVAALGRLGRPLQLDAGLAVMRVPPDEYEQLRLPSAHRVGKMLNEQLQLLRNHQPEWELVVGDSRGRFRMDVYKRAVTWRDRAAPKGGTSNFVAAVLDRRDPLTNLALEATDGEYTARFEQVTGMWPLMLPHHPDVLAAHAHARLNRALTKNRSAIEPLLDAIGSAAQPIGPPALSALVLGLAAKNGVERTRAVDAVVDLSTRGGLDGATLAAQLSALLTADAVVGSRIVPGLADAARADQAAAANVIECLAATLPALEGRRDAHQFVDLLAQLAIQEGRAVSLPESFGRLAASKQTSMLAKACRRVPQASE